MTRAPVIALALALALVPSAARGGTYGAESRAYAGFRASIDCSVGHSSDHRGEGELYRRKREEARARLEASEPQLLRMYRHFSTGKHRWTRLRAVLDGRELTDVPYERTARVELGERVQLSLYTKEQLDQARLEKLAADFIAAQLTTGGALATPGAGASDAAAEEALEEILLGPIFSGGALLTGDLYRLLNESRRAEPALRALAKLDQPVPITDRWLAPQARAGWIAAQIVVCALDGKPYPAGLHARLATLEAAPRAGAIRLMALLLPDGDFPSGLAALERDAAGEALLVEWLHALAK
ncbi:MAG TPA: hypothetical protein VFF06_21615 [Polyangia bacterium]|nr:hypothetical protein [Polyangia bacterium]